MWQGGDGAAPTRQKAPQNMVCRIFSAGFLCIDARAGNTGSPTLGN
jgi:hypothetical protein